MARALAAPIVTGFKPGTEAAEGGVLEAPVVGIGRARVQGKFLHADGRKFWVRGVTYGPFCPGSNDSEYHDERIVERDFAAMAAAGLNAVRVYTVPPRWLLDAAAERGLRVMVGAPWEQHVTFLDDRGRRPRWSRLNSFER